MNVLFNFKTLNLNIKKLTKLTKLLFYIIKKIQFLKFPHPQSLNCTIYNVIIIIYFSNTHYYNITQLRDALFSTLSYGTSVNSLAPAMNNYTSAHTSQMIYHQVVLAKFAPYPMWPAKVEYMQGADKYYVRFFGNLHQMFVLNQSNSHIQFFLFDRFETVFLYYDFCSFYSSSVINIICSNREISII